MKVVNARDSFLSNWEVLAHLNEMKERYSKQAEQIKAQIPNARPMKAGNLETVLMEVKEYLSSTPAKDQSEESIATFMERVAKFKLEKVELLMIINNKPTSYPELDVLVEEMEQRFGEDGVEEIIGIVKECFGWEEPEEMDEAEG